MAPLQPPWQPAYRRRAPPPPPTFQHIFDSWANSSSIPVVDLDEEEEGIVLQQARQPQRLNYMPNRRPLLSNLDSPPTTAAPWPSPKKPVNVWRNHQSKPGPPEPQENKPKRYFSVEPQRKSSNWDAVPSTVGDASANYGHAGLRPLRYESYRNFSVSNGCSGAPAPTDKVSRASDTEDERDESNHLAFFNPASPTPLINHSEAEMATDSPGEDEDKREAMVDVVVSEELPTSATVSEEVTRSDDAVTAEEEAGSTQPVDEVMESHQPEATEVCPGTPPLPAAEPAKDKATVAVQHEGKKRKRKIKTKSSSTSERQSAPAESRGLAVDVFDENEILSCGLLLRSSVTCRRLRTQIQELAQTYWRHRRNEVRLRAELGDLVGETLLQDAPGQSEFDGAIVTIAESADVSVGQKAQPVKNEGGSAALSEASADLKRPSQISRTRKHKETREHRRISAARRRLSAGARKSTAQ